jgi:large conductance mechanosensitive channel
MHKFFLEFKKFIARGNVIDLAVAVIIGAAFGKITTSLVADIIMPFVGLLLGGLSVADWKWVLQPATYDAAGVVQTAEIAVNFGSFVQAILDFLIIAFIIFLLVKIFNAANRGLDELKAERELYRQLRKEGKSRKVAKAILKEKRGEAPESDER